MANPTIQGRVDELGDLLFSIVSLANATDVDVETALDRTLAKYRRRLTERGTPGSA
jgi:NTP pyrophosphatase (non-canonical NTP hydrolase)